MIFDDFGYFKCFLFQNSFSEISFPQHDTSRSQPVHYLAKNLSKSRQEKVKKKSRPKKSWARSSRKFFQKAKSKFITTTPNMGRRFSAAPFFARAPLGAHPQNAAALKRRPIFGSVVVNFEPVFWRNLLELLAELFLRRVFFLDFSLRHFPTFFPIIKAVIFDKFFTPTN